MNELIDEENNKICGFMAVSYLYDFNNNVDALTLNLLTSRSFRDDNYKGYEIISDKLKEFGFELIDTRRIGMWWTQPDGSSIFEPGDQYEERWKKTKTPLVFSVKSLLPKVIILKRLTKTRSYS